VEYQTDQTDQKIKKKMGFNKRYLSESSIRSMADSNQENFPGFQRYMTSADAYIIEGSWASRIYNKFSKADLETQEQIFVNIILKKI